MVATHHHGDGTVGRFVGVGTRLSRGAIYLHPVLNENTGHIRVLSRFSSLLDC